MEAEQNQLDFSVIHLNARYLTEVIAAAPINVHRSFVPPKLHLYRVRFRGNSIP